MERRIGFKILILSVLSVVPGPAYAQKPVVNPGGVVNAATFAPMGQPGYGVGAGSLASVFGQNLASETAWAEGFPLPTMLAGTSVTFGGVPAPLIYVSPTQINLQVPIKAPGDFVPTDVPGGYVYLTPVVVTTPVGASEPQAVPFGNNLGIFTLDASGCGRGAVLTVAPDGSLSLNGPDNGVEPGGMLALYGTGIAGNAYPKLPDGMPAPASPPVPYSMNLFSILNEKWVSSRYVAFVGAAPGYAGLDQVNIRVPEDAPEGCSIPLQFVVESFSRSQTIPVSIRRGGGRCVDAPDSLAFLLWTRTVATGIDPPPPTDTLSIEFSSGIGKKAPAFPLRLRPGEYVTGISALTGEPYAGWVFPPGPACPAFSEDRLLDAGILTADAPGLSLQIAPETVNGQPPRYSATLPADAVGPGSYRITGAGGANVGAFTTTLKVPEPIRLLTQFPPGTTIRLGYPPVLFIRWEGGDADSTVTVKIFDKNQFFTSGPVPASVGQLGPAAMSGPVEIVVTQTVVQPRMERFQAGGLTLGGWHVWSYEFRFGGVGIVTTFPTGELKTTGDGRP